MYKQHIRMKYCIKCKKELSIDNFCKKEHASDGFQSYCRDCNKKFLKDREDFQKRILVKKLIKILEPYRSK